MKTQAKLHKIRNKIITVSLETVRTQGFMDIMKILLTLYKKSVIISTKGGRENGKENRKCKSRYNYA